MLQLNMINQYDQSMNLISFGITSIDSDIAWIDLAEDIARGGQVAAIMFPFTPTFRAIPPPLYVP